MGTLDKLWLPSLALPQTAVNPIRGSSIIAPVVSLTSVTTGSLTPTANDLLLGACFSGGNPHFNTFTWSGGETNHNAAQTSAFGGTSVSLNYAIAGSATTFNFTTTTAQSLGAIFADLIPANSGVAPTFNATSAAVSASGPLNTWTITLGSYTTVANDCIVIIGAGANGASAETWAGAGAGATWRTLQDSSANVPSMFMLVGTGCTSGHTSATVNLTVAGGGTDTASFAVAVFSGVHT